MVTRAKKENTISTEKAAKGIQKVTTQIEGLDEILHGGFPAGRTTLISGGPGTGKSLLGLEFLYRGAISGNPGIFLTFEETAEAVRQNALTFGWDLALQEQAGTLFLMEGQVDPDVLLSGDFNLRGLFAIIEGKAKAMGADRIVIDAMDILMRFFGDPRRQQNEIFALNKWLKDQGMTAILTSKNTKGGDSAEYSYLDFMADCVLYLDQRVRQQVSTKRLQVIKYRGSAYSGNEYPFLVAEDGIHFNPITDVEMHYESSAKRTSSGNPSLDAILGGGYQIGSCILVSGATGTGKTSLACTFARSACKSGEKVLYISYEESQDGIIAGMLSLGIDLRPAIKDSLLKIMAVMPESMGIEEHLFRMMTTIGRFEPQNLVLDAISACERIAGEKAAFDLLVRFVDACRKRGITVVLTNQAKASARGYEISGIGISSIIDSIINLYFKETGNETSRTLLVRKSRGTSHSTKFHNFALTDQGIQIQEGAGS
jgi:circadian clock protein KaiC